MSLRNDQSPEIMALDAAVEANRRADVQSTLGNEDDLLAGDGSLVSVVKLTPRAPWFDGLAALYCFNASRWDTPANLVYCFPNQAPPGSWNGTVVYVDFTAPQPGEYRIVARYHGPNAQVRFRGPWGIVNKTMPAGQDSDTIAATWTGSGNLWCTLSFSGEWIGMISAVQIGRVAP